MLLTSLTTRLCGQYLLQSTKFISNEEGLNITLWEFAYGPSEIAAMEGGSIDLGLYWSWRAQALYQ
jgi:ABC-type nitrate/sulfonate/bicarbonate transport system substrate-binding protein